MIACYYTLIGCCGLYAFTYFIATGDKTIVAFRDYFTCQSFGIVQGLDCGDIPGVHPPLPQVFGGLTLVSVILIGLLPLINLIFTVKLTCKCFVNLKKLYVLHKTLDNHASSKAATIGIRNPTIIDNSLNL